jgi:hypothetical protein
VADDGRWVEWLAGRSWARVGLREREQEGRGREERERGNTSLCRMLEH